MKEGTTVAEELVRSIVGLPVRIKLGYGSFLTLDFGKEIVKRIHDS